MSFSDLGTIASIISLGVSIFVLIEVRKIKNAFKLRVRGPVIIKELEAYSSNLSACLDEFEDSLPRIADEFGKSRAKLKYLKQNLSSSPRSSVKRLLKSIEKCEITLDNKDGIWRVYVEMKQVLEEVKDHQKDIKLGV